MYFNKDASANALNTSSIIVRVLTKERSFLVWVGQALKLKWQDQKSNEDVRQLLGDVLPCFACGCVDNNDLISLQEILVRMDVNIGDYDGTTPLHKACENGKMNIVKYLLSRGATTQLQDRHGRTPLHVAIKNRHLEIIRILRLEGATLSLKPVNIGMELVKAVKARDYKLLKAWYLAGVKMDEPDYNGRTTMHAAVRLRDKAMVVLLLEYGATSLVKDTWGQTAVEEAQKNNLLSILTLFHHY